MEFLQFLSSLAHLPDSWRQWVGGVVTLVAAISVPAFEPDEIAVVYIFLILLAGGVLTALWEGKAKRRRRH